MGVVIFFFAWPPTVAVAVDGVFHCCLLAIVLAVAVCSELYGHGGERSGGDDREREAGW